MRLSLQCREVSQIGFSSSANGQSVMLSAVFLLSSVFYCRRRHEALCSIVMRLCGAPAAACLQAPALSLVLSAVARLSSVRHCPSTLTVTALSMWDAG
jgi:hypothetical protein